MLDEPASAPDLAIQAQIIDLLRELRRKQDLSYLFINHDLMVVHAPCDNILVMLNGRVAKAGSTIDVLENPKTPYTDRLVRAAMTPHAA